jgi:hypothetical protein
LDNIRWLLLHTWGLSKGALVEMKKKFKICKSWRRNFFANKPEWSVWQSVFELTFISCKKIIKIIKIAKKNYGKIAESSNFDGFLRKKKSPVIKFSSSCFRRSGFSDHFPILWRYFAMKTFGINKAMFCSPHPWGSLINPSKDFSLDDKVASMGAQPSAGKNQEKIADSEKKLFRKKELFWKKTKKKTFSKKTKKKSIFFAPLIRINKDLKGKEVAKKIRINGFFYC